MASKLFEMMNNMPQMSGAMGNFQNVMNQYQQFRSMFRGGGQQAQNQVVQMLNSGQITKEQLQQAVQMAQAYRNK